MIDVLRSLLSRAEVCGEDVLHRHDVRAWPESMLDRLVSAGVLRSIAQAAELEYAGCEHDCLIDRNFQPHPDDETRVICLHRCGLGCGLVIVTPQEFDRWEFSLVGLGGAVKDAIAASGQVVEDVRDRIVSIGVLGNPARTVEVFLARGLQWPDARTMLQGANRLKAAQNPFVLTLATPALQNAWPKMSPASAVLLEHVGGASGRRLLSLDMSPLLSLDSIPHPDSGSPHWLINKAAAIKLQDIVDGLTFAKAKARVSAACARDEFRTNGQSGNDLRIDVHSFSTWLLAQRDKNLAEDNDADGHIEVPRRSAPRRASATRR